MSAQHTPGPWSFIDDSWCDKVIYARLHQVNERRIALFCLDEDASEEEAAIEIANGRLIAAAPDLLDALQSCLSRLECLDPPQPGYGPSQPILDARAAIAKTTGAAK